NTCYGTVTAGKGDQLTIRISSREYWTAMLELELGAIHNNLVLGSRTVSNVFYDFTLDNDAPASATLLAKAALCRFRLADTGLGPPQFNLVHTFESKLLNPGKPPSGGWDLFNHNLKAVSQP